MNPSRCTLILALAISLGVAAPGPLEFNKQNRDPIVTSILVAIAKETGATTALSDSGSGTPGQDMDVTAKMTLRRPDGSIDNDLTLHFFEMAKKLYPDGDFSLDEHGALRSKKLDTAVHDAKNAVPDFRSVLPVEAFKVQFIVALDAKRQNPDAYFTAGGNHKQVVLRMQTKSRLRVFQPNGGTEEVTIERGTKEYDAAMKKYFGMNPEDVTAHSHQRDLFGDSFDAYRQARTPDHAKDQQNIRGDPKYNTRIINNFLEMNGFPTGWSGLSPTEKQRAMGLLFPDDPRGVAGAKTIPVLDAAFTIYDNRDLGGTTAVGDQSDRRVISEEFQRAAIVAMAEKRLPDLLNPNVSLQDLKDHAQAIAQKAGKSWSDLPEKERAKYLQDAQRNTPDLVEKLKFAAAGEFGMVFKTLDGMNNAQAARLKAQVIAKVSPEQRPYVQSQIDLALASLRDSKTAGNDALKNRKSALDRARELILEHRYVVAGRQHLRKAGTATALAYQRVRADWESVKFSLEDPSSKRMAGALDKMDKTQSMLNLVKVYQDSNGDKEVMKRAVYMEAMSRTVPGYDSYQMYTLWKSGDPQAQEQVQNALVFQGLTMLPGGAIARGMKLAFDVARTGLEITIGSGLNEIGDQAVRNAFVGAQDSILQGVTGNSVEEQRRNLYPAWNSVLKLEIAIKRMDAQRKAWNDRPPYEKEAKVNQEAYLRTIHAFNETVHRQISLEVDDYLALKGVGGNAGYGGPKEKLISLLFADYVNGYNRKIGESLMKGLEREAEEAQSVFDEVDDYMFLLFSKSLDVAMDAMVRTDPVPSPQHRWDLRFHASKVDLDQENRGVTVRSAVQAIPPPNSTFEERNTAYGLLMHEHPELQTQIVNGRVKFRLRHPRTQAIVVEKDFVLGDVTFDKVAKIPAVAARVPATGVWVLEKTEFVVQELSAEWMQKLQPTESGEDGAGSAQGIFGHPDPKVNTVTVRMKVAWTPPPKVLVPGEAIDFRITVSDAGTDARGLGVGGAGSIIANYPSRSAVWHGPAAHYELKLGERSKEASKAYTPLQGSPGDTMYIYAEYGVFIRRNQYFYLYKFTADPASVPAAIRTSSVPTAKPQVVTDRLGHEWSITEAVTYAGRWVRRGDSEIWDATWSNGAVAELSITIAGDKVRISRKDGGFSLGLTATYEGTLAPDGTVQGTSTTTWPGHFTNQVSSWQGRVVK